MWIFVVVHSACESDEAIDQAVLGKLPPCPSMLPVM